jgi:hypothetical protein
MSKLRPHRYHGPRIVAIGIGARIQPAEERWANDKDFVVHNKIQRFFGEK